MHFFYSIIQSSELLFSTKVGGQQQEVLQIWVNILSTDYKSRKTYVYCKVKKNTVFLALQSRSVQAVNIRFLVFYRTQGLSQEGKSSVLILYMHLTSFKLPVRKHILSINYGCV